MEKSFEIDFDEWELIPSPHRHSFIEFDLRSDAENFAEDNKNSCKDIMIVPQPSPILLPTVSFKKLNDDELCTVNMKLDSPKICIPDQKLLYCSENEYSDDDDYYKGEKSIEKEAEKIEIDVEEKRPVFRWRVLGGAGSLCSIGFAALTLCVFILGSRQSHNESKKKNQFQVYANEKKIKEAVQEVSRMNQAFSGGRRGKTAATRARVLLGGYYNGFV